MRLHCVTGGCTFTVLVVWERAAELSQEVKDCILGNAILSRLLVLTLDRSQCCRWICEKCGEKMQYGRKAQLLLNAIMGATGEKNENAAMQLLSPLGCAWMPSQELSAVVQVRL